MALSADNLMQAIRQAGDLYYRLVLLAGPQGTGKTAVLQALAKANQYPLINVNLQLCKGMLELTRNQRTRQVERLFKTVVGSGTGDVVLLDNLEVLFDPSLEVVPLRLLLAASRNQTLVASWNGTYKDGTLTYAEPGHPEFIQYKQVEALVVSLDSDGHNG
jgi:RNase adaptor protein for sRNA GlmZ degradation